jgi:hypothetical protein
MLAFAEYPGEINWHQKCTEWQQTTKGSGNNIWRLLSLCASPYVGTTGIINYRLISIHDCCIVHNYVNITAYS